MRNKIVMLALFTSILLSSCGESNLRYRKECHEVGGEVTVVGSQVRCLKDGAVIAEWVEYRE